MPDGLPLQVGQAEERANDLMKQHAAGGNPGAADEKPVIQDQEPTAEELKKQLDDTKHKLSVLQGKYSKEIENVDLKDNQRLRNENTALKRQMNEMQQALAANQQLLEDVNKKLEQDHPPQQHDTPVDLSKVLSDEDRQILKSEDISDEVLPIILKIAQVAGGGNLANQVRQLSTEMKTVSQQVQQTAKQQTDNTLLGMIPDFWTINEVWGNWLDSTFRRDSIQAAFNRQDFASVKEAIDLFKTETGWKPATSANGDGKQTPGDTPKTKPKTPPIHPGESLVGDQVPVKDKPTYTEPQVKKHYEDNTKGLWNGREKEWQRIADDMYLAAYEGRITA